MLGDFHFSLKDQLLYRFSTYWPKANKIWILEVNNKCFPTTVQLITSTIVSTLSWPKRYYFWTIHSVKKRFSTVLIYLLDPSKLNSITAPSFQWSKDCQSFEKLYISCKVIFSEVRRNREPFHWWQYQILPYRRCYRPQRRPIKS